MNRTLIFTSGVTAVLFAAHLGCSSNSDSADDGAGGSSALPGEGNAPGTSTDSGTSTGVPTYTATGTGTSTGVGVAPPVNPDPNEPDPEPATCDQLDNTKPAVLYLSADDSNSMASPVRAREWLNQGGVPDAIRTYEFLNFYNIGYPAPTSGALGLSADLKPAQDAGDYDLQLGIRSADPTTPRRPVTVTFVLDTSGSMGGEPILRERAAIQAIASELVAGDIVNAVTWNTQNAVVMANHTVSGPNDLAVLAMATSLTTGGGTDLHGGLVAGYDLAQQTYGPNRINRIVLISDGGANVGVTDKDLIAENSFDADQEGIYMVGVGVGPLGGYHDNLMDTVTDAGRGAYVYLDSVDAADELLADRFDEVFEVAARSVQIELTLPWYFQVQAFYGEEISENPEEVEPQHLAPGDAMVLSQVLRACDPAIVDPNDPIGVHVTWTTPISYVDHELSYSATLGELLAAPSPTLDKGRAVVAYAEALKDGSTTALQEAHAVVVAANPASLDPELTAIATLLTQHPAF